MLSLIICVIALIVYCVICERKYKILSDSYNSLLDKYNKLSGGGNDG